MVLHEEKQPKCSNSQGGGGGSRSSKKNKPKKIPQRGLGVAQLEKIRLEEQQKNNPSSSSSNPPPSLATILPIHQQPTLPFLASEPTPLFRPIIDSTPLLKPSIPMPSPSVDFLNPPTFHSLDVAAVAGGTGHGFLPMLWNAMDQNPQDSAETAASRKSSFSTPLLPGDSSNSNLGWQSTSVLQQRQQQQQQQPVQLVNNKILSPSSSGVSLQMEPPSNQSYSSNFIMTSPWQEDVRMVGAKRSWPFDPGNMSGHTSYTCRGHPITTPFLKPDETISTYGNEPIKFDPRLAARREGASSSGIFQADWRSSEFRSDKRARENFAAMDDGFLSLAPSPTQQSSMMRPKQPMIIAPAHHSEPPEFSLSSSLSRGGADDAVSRPQGSLQQPYYSFFPMGPSVPESASTDQSDEARDGVDLNLKLYQIL